MGTPNDTARAKAPLPGAAWHPGMRTAFRFCVAYLGLYCLTTRISGGLFLLPDRSVTSLGTLWPLRDITVWVASHAFNITEPLDASGNSWDTNFFWVQAFWVLILAVAATSLWSVLDRKRGNYVVLNKWFRVFIRLAIASQMLEYGMTKVIPVQFPFPSLITLVTPVGNVSLQGMLWTFVGASPTYQTLTGVVEVVAALLLLVPRTTALGAVIVLASMSQVFAFNMLYDLGVKMVSFHLILMTVFLLAPESSRLGRFFLTDRPVGPSVQPPLCRTRRANAIALGAQILFGLYALGVYTNATWIYWYQEGVGSPRSPLYGIWNVERLTIDGQVRPAVLNDYDRRWRRVILDDPGTMVFQRTDDSFARYGVSIDIVANTLDLTKGGSGTWTSSFAFQGPENDRLILEGEMDDYRIGMELRLVQPDTFQLLNSHFRWVRPPDP